LSSTLSVTYHNWRDHFSHPSKIIELYIEYSYKNQNFVRLKNYMVLPKTLGNLTIKKSFLP
jgi:hypothetical protein